MIIINLLLLLDFNYYYYYFIITIGWVLTPLVEKQIIDRTLISNLTFSDETHKLLSEKQPSGYIIIVLL